MMFRGTTNASFVRSYTRYERNFSILAASYNAVSLRHAILRQLADAALQDRIWVGVADQDAMSLTNLRATLAANAARFRGRSLHEWFQAMQDPNEFGDANTLIGGMLLFRVRIRVLSTDGVVHVEAPAIFGDDFAPIHGDIVLALHSEIHYLSTTPAVPPAASLCEPSLNSPQPLPSPVPQQTLAASLSQRPPDRPQPSPSPVPQQTSCNDDQAWTDGYENGEREANERAADKRVAQLHMLQAREGAFPRWIKERYKEVIRPFAGEGGLLCGGLRDSLQEHPRRERIVLAVRDHVQGDVRCAF